MRKVLAIACITALAAFGAAACGSKSEGGGGGGGGGEINVALTSFPDYVDPQLSYTVEGWEVLWNVYTPLLTYKHAKGKDGTQVVPGLAKDMPEISPDGKTYKLKLRPEHEVLRRHADQGIRLHLRASSGCSRPTPAARCSTTASSAPRTTPTARRRRSAASRPTTPPATSPSR